MLLVQVIHDLTTRDYVYSSKKLGQKPFFKRFNKIISGDAVGFLRKMPPWVISRGFEVLRSLGATEVDRLVIGFSGSYRELFEAKSFEQIGFRMLLKSSEIEWSDIS